MSASPGAPLDAIAAVLERLPPDEARRFAGLAAVNRILGLEPLRAVGPDTLAHVEHRSPAVATISLALAKSAVPPIGDVGFPERELFVFAALSPSDADIVNAEMQARSGRVISHEPVLCNTWVYHRTDCEEESVDPRGVVLPADFIIDILVPDDAAVLAHHWKYSEGAATARSLREAIAAGLPTACVRRRDVPQELTLEHGGPRGLCSWAMVRLDGSIGLMHTLEAHRGRGLAVAVLSRLVKLQGQWVQRLATEAATSGEASFVTILSRIQPFCHVVLGNVASERVITRVGFIRSGRADWHYWRRLSPSLPPGQ